MRKPGSRRQPRQERSRATVAAILEAAAALLVEHDVETLSTREIAARAGVGVGSLYEYFDGKDAIVGRLVDDFAASIRSRVQDVFDRRSDEDLDTLLRRLLRSTIEVYNQNSRAHARLLRHVPHLSGSSALDVIEGPIRSEFAALLRDRATELDVGSIDVAAQVCVHTARRMIDAACADPGLTLDLVAVEGEIAEMLRRYLHGRRRIVQGSPVP